MTGRIDAIKSLIVPAKVIADVGCDHGLVAAYCAESGICERVIASDISEACLNKARLVLSGHGNVIFIACDGIGYECDEAVIAGMGGILIGSILERATVLPQTVIVCPHRDPDIVRRTLNRLRYSIDGDIIVEERGKLYFVMRARLTEVAQELSELQYLFGVHYAENCDLLKEYLQRLYNVCMLAPQKNERKINMVRLAMRAQGMTPD